MTPEALALVPLDDLVDEISRRSETCVVACHQEEQPTGLCEDTVRWRGNPVLALGLIGRLQHTINTHIDEHSEIQERP